MNLILEKILTSKVFSVSVLVILVVLSVLLVISQIKANSLEGKIETLNKTIDNRDTEIVNLNRQIQTRDLEIRYLQKGLDIVKAFEEGKEKVLEDETATKVQVLQTVLSSEENKDWWNTPIPDDILNLITCH